MSYVLSLSLSIIEKLRDEVSNKVIKKAVNHALSKQGLDISATTQTISNRKLTVFPGYGQRETVVSLTEELEKMNVIKTMDLSQGLKKAFIVITTPELLDALSRFGQEAIMMDSTHGTNHYDLKLNTIVVLKPNLEFLVVAFCLSPEEDEITIAKFLREVLPDGLRTSVFMTDMAQSYYNAWKLVGGKEDERRICLWHVRKAWKRQTGYKLNRGLGDEVLKELDELANVAEEMVFKAKFDAMLDRWGRDDEYKAFSTYFVKMYKTQFPPQLWARCYVKDGGPRFNMAIENFHKQFKYYEMEGLPQKRLDVLIKGLHDYLETAGCLYVHEIEKQPWKKRDNGVVERHSKAETVTDITASGNNTWFVGSATTNRTYTVTWTGPCKFIGCLRCRQCRICRHVMMCSCPDRSGGHICKHLHAVVARYPELKDRIPIITDPDRMREMKWGQTLRPSRSKGFTESEPGPEWLLETESDVDTLPATEGRPLPATEGAPEYDSDVDILPVAEEMPEWIYENMSDDGDTGAPDQRLPTEEISPPDYDSDDPSRLLQEFQKMPRDKRVKMINRFQAHLIQANRVPIPPSNKKAVKQTLYPKKK